MAASVRWQDLRVRVTTLGFIFGDAHIRDDKLGHRSVGNGDLADPFALFRGEQSDVMIMHQEGAPTLPGVTKAAIGANTNPVAYISLIQ